MVKHIIHTKCDYCGRTLCVSVYTGDAPEIQPLITLCKECVDTIDAQMNGTGINNLLKHTGETRNGEQ